MERKFRKKICIALASLMSLSCIGFAGCNGETEKPASSGSGKNLFPTYADDKVMMIGGWDAPINTLEDYQFAADMGLTMMFIDEVFVPRGSQEYKDVLGYCNEVGMDAILTLGNSATNELAQSSWESDTTDYLQYPSVKAINYWDEPHRENLDRIAELASEHVKKYGNKIDFYVNHYPNTSTHAFGGLSYYNFIKEYSEKVLTQLDEGHRWLSADIYPLLGNNTVRNTWLAGIEALAINAKNYNAKTHFFIQITEHWDYRKVSEADVRWQFFVNMAFGVQAFSYFTYRDSFIQDQKFEDSCVSGKKSCVAHEEYYWAQTVNREILSFDHVYLNFDWQGTMPVIGDNNTSGTNANFTRLEYELDSVECLNGVTSTEDALVGAFKDKDGNDGLIVTNFTDPYNGTKNKVTLKFKDADRARVYYRGECKDYVVFDNEMTISLNAGDGVFVIPMAN